MLYLADSLGYLGYGVVLVARNTVEKDGEVLPYFLQLLVVIAVLSFISLLLAILYFQRVLRIPNDRNRKALGGES